jgi:trans-aconitate 2-methyltransferase
MGYCAARRCRASPVSVELLWAPTRWVTLAFTDGMTEWSGEDYANISALQRAMAEEAVGSLQFAGTECVLDVGCGDGYVTGMVAGMVPDGYVVGIDPSRGMLAEAVRRDRFGASGPVFVRADVRDLPFAESFDAAVSFNALHWVPQQQAALSQIAAVVHPGAGVLIQVVCAGERPSVESVAMTLCDRPHWAPRFAGFTAPFIHVDPAVFEGSAAAAGFAVARLTVTDRQWDFGTRERFARWCSVGGTAWTDRLNVDDRPRFVEELVSAYEAVSGRPGLFRFTQMRVELVRR